MQNTNQLTVHLDDQAIEALKRYRHAQFAFDAVGHGGKNGAELFLAAEKAAEHLGKLIAALAPDFNSAQAHSPNARAAQIEVDAVSPKDIQERTL